MSMILFWSLKLMLDFQSMHAIAIYGIFYLKKIGIQRRRDHLRSMNVPIYK